jgi:hypothetical protein
MAKQAITWHPIYRNKTMQHTCFMSMFQGYISCNAYECMMMIMLMIANANARLTPGCYTDPSPWPSMKADPPLAPSMEPDPRVGRRDGAAAVEEMGAASTPRHPPRDLRCRRAGPSPPSAWPIGTWVHGARRRCTCVRS